MTKHPTYEEVLKRELKDPEFRTIWEAGETRRRVVSTLIGERIKRKLTQDQLAKRAGIKRPSLARIEGGHVNPSLMILEKVARALNTRLVIQFRPL